MQTTVMIDPDVEELLQAAVREQPASSNGSPRADCRDETDRHEAELDQVRHRAAGGKKDRPECSA